MNPHKPGSAEWQWYEDELHAEADAMKFAKAGDRDDYLWASRRAYDLKARLYAALCLRSLTKSLPGRDEMLVLPPMFDATGEHVLITPFSWLTGRWVSVRVLEGN
jgi:hypothetical protein